MKSFSHHSHKGFTLVELLIVIVVVVVLSLVVVLVLNPSELLRRARDSNRIADIASLRTSLALYLANVPVPALSSSTGYNRCYLTAATTSCTFGFSTFTAASPALTTSTATTTSVNSSGWIPVDFTQISSGAPLGSLPLDPTNNSSCFYGFAATSTNLTYKIIASCMESARYGQNGSNDLVQTDGGSFPRVYEIGTNLTL